MQLINFAFIYQGMDPFNERRVFDLLVDTCQRTSAQYFLVTPKVANKISFIDVKKKFKK